MPNPNSEPKQPTEATSAHAGWLTRAQVAAELGYRSIFPIRKMEGTKLHPVREARGWVFDPAEVAELKTARMAAGPLPAAPLPQGRLAARVFYLLQEVGAGGAPAAPRGGGATRARAADRARAEELREDHGRDPPAPEGRMILSERDPCARCMADQGTLFPRTAREPATSIGET